MSSHVGVFVVVDQQHSLAHLRETNTLFIIIALARQSVWLGVWVRVSDVYFRYVLSGCSGHFASGFVGESVYIVACEIHGLNSF